MNDIPESVLYEGLSVDLQFADDRPVFGDLFAICGYENPAFPPSGRFNFLQFDDLQFSQVDDYFGIQTLSGEGDDVAVWLYPLVAGEVVDHHPGPFDGIRLSYNVLRHPIERSDFFLKAIQRLSAQLPVTMLYQGRRGDIAQVKKDIGAIEAYWRAEGIRPGSDEALEIDH